MFRTRRFLFIVLALAVLPMVGCGSWKCCRNQCSSARPAYYSAPACSSCSSPAGAPVVVGQ
jgi:hypothetical protein